MLEVSKDDIRRRIARDNAWWSGSIALSSPVKDYPKRFYFEEFYKIIVDLRVRRAIVLMGPRRVGKTVMLFQLVEKLISTGANPNNILYVSIDAPIYSGIPLASFLDFFENPPEENRIEDYFVLFDEIQYLPNWESHLKDLVDSFSNVKFIASGSAAAALRLASVESGAGRFTDFQLPPLTFAEFIDFIGRTEELIFTSSDSRRPSKLIYNTNNISQLNAEFVNYLNFGGYPEAALSPQVRESADIFVRNDIIDKVLLKDLPALYGISNIQELNSLFSHLAYNTGQEISLQSLSSKSGVSKPTISKYIEYLESAFLVSKISRIDNNAKRFSRETTFKTYLNNPSMRAALFSPVSSNNSDLIGHLAESAIFAQWCHGPTIKDLYYARWKGHEVDIVHMTGAEFIPTWAVEIKWSDNVVSRARSELSGLVEFSRKNRVAELLFTTRTQSGEIEIDSTNIRYTPCSLYCYTVGRNISRTARARRGAELG